MKVLLCLAMCIAAVMAESCSSPNDCRQTECHTEHGWWLHCKSGSCVCTHDTYAGKPCPDGTSDSCLATHGSRCTDMNLHWRCIDNTCHCSKQSDCEDMVAGLDLHWSQYLAFDRHWAISITNYSYRYKITAPMAN